VRTPYGWRTRHVRYLGKTGAGGVTASRPGEVSGAPAPAPAPKPEEKPEEPREEWGIEMLQREAEEVTGKLPAEEEEEPSEKGEEYESGLDILQREAEEVTGKPKPEEPEEEPEPEVSVRRPAESERWGIDAFREEAEEGYEPTYTPGEGLDSIRAAELGAAIERGVEAVRRASARRRASRRRRRPPEEEEPEEKREEPEVRPAAEALVPRPAEVPPEEPHVASEVVSEQSAEEPVSVPRPSEPSGSGEEESG